MKVNLLYAVKDGEMFREIPEATRANLASFDSPFSGEDAADHAFRVTNAPTSVLSPADAAIARNLRMARVRSLSVGDAVEVNGEIFMCCGCGWKKIN